MNAALANGKLGLIDAWLRPLRKLRAENAKNWEGLAEGERALKLVEANVRSGVQTLLENADVIEGVKERGVQVHGAVYDIASGEVRELAIEEGEEEGRVRHLAFHTKA